jgi:ATP-binding cassette subfamily B (MDR/TAP) protein 8
MLGVCTTGAAMLVSATTGVVLAEGSGVEFRVGRVPPVLERSSLPLEVELPREKLEDQFAQPRDDPPTHTKDETSTKPGEHIASATSSIATHDSASPSQTIWSWVYNAARMDWILYAAAAAASIGMAICAVMEAREFGAIYDIFSQSNGSIADSSRRLIVLFVTEFGLSFSASTLLAVATNRLGQRLRESYFKAVLVQDMAFYDARRQGELMQHISEDIASIQSAVRQVFTTGLRSTMNVVVGTVSLFSVSPILSGCVLGILPILGLTAHLLGMGLQSLSKRVSRAQGYATSIANEATSNVRTVKAFVGETREEIRYRSALENAVGVKIALAMATGSFFGAIHLGMNAVQLMLCLVGSNLISSGQLAPGGMITITSQVMQLTRAFQGLSKTSTGLFKAIATCDGVFEVVCSRPALEAAAGLQTVSHDTVIGEVEFSSVDFRYPSRPLHPVLSQFSLKIPPGKVYALVGPSGCGKSTVGNLIERFYDPDKGEVLLDGTSLQLLEPKSLRKVIGLVDQSPTLFAATIMDNLRYGRPNASDDDIIEAAKAANAHQFISNFPDGYNTVLGDKGSQLSGGQRQRIAIARAILKDPNILVLDEATSALDASSERLVQDALSRLMEGRTVLIIAHRLSTVIDADVICVLSKGKVVEKGNHMDLMSLGGQYADLFRKQQKEGVVK